MNAFGVSTTINPGVSYTVGSDGFLVVHVSATGTCNAGVVQVLALVNGSEIRQSTSAHGGCNTIDYPTAQAGFTMPVRKGESFQVLLGGTANFTGIFVPLGR